MRVLWLSLLLLAACSAAPAPTPVPTRQLSAATLAPSPPVPILSSEQLYEATLSAGQNAPTAAALPNNAPLPPQSSAANAEGVQQVTITLSAALMVQGDLYAANGQQRLPAVILLAEERAAWGALPLALQARGLAVLAVDWPAEGQAEDVGRLLESLSELASIDPGRLALAAAGPSGMAALRGCALEALCDGLALLSPPQANSEALAQLLPRPVLLVASADDQASVSAVQAMLAQPGVLSIRAEAGQGAPMVANSPPLIAALVDWLSALLQPSP